MLFKSFKTLLKSQAILFNNYFRFGVIKFNLPDLGQKIKEGTIKKLYVKQGDKVQEFQKLADVASDKQFTEITAADSGIIKKIHYNQEDVCQVGELFLQIEVEESASGNSTTEQTKIQQKTESYHKNQTKAEQNKLSNPQDILATPYVRGLMKKYNLKSQQIQGSGAEGRILQADIMAIVQGKKPKRVPSIQFGKRAKQPQLQSPHHKLIKPSDLEKEKVQKKSIIHIAGETSQVHKMSLFEKGMQKSMTVANTIPHLYYHQQIDLTQCEKLRSTLKVSKKKVTVMGLLIKTFSMALKKYPRINSTYHPSTKEFEYTVHHNHNISLAIDSPNGLVVPNIKNVQAMTLIQIQSQIQRLRNLAIQAKLTSNELNNGTVCISNIGTIGGIMANPLILAPQTCIVAIGKLQTVGRFNSNDRQFDPRSVINVSFGCDHRIIDGATVAKFSNEWKLLLQNPYIAMAQMV